MLCSPAPQFLPRTGLAVEHVDFCVNSWSLTVAHACGMIVVYSFEKDAKNITVQFVECAIDGEVYRSPQPATISSPDNQVATPTAASPVVGIQSDPAQAQTTVPLDKLIEPSAAAASKVTSAPASKPASKTESKPLKQPSSSEKKAMVQQVVSLGFMKDVAQKELEANHWDLQETVLILFEQMGIPRPDALDAHSHSEAAQEANQPAPSESMPEPMANQAIPPPEQSTTTIPVTTDPAQVTTAQPVTSLPSPGATDATLSGQQASSTPFVIKALPGFQVVCCFSCTASGQRQVSG